MHASHFLYNMQHLFVLVIISWIVSINTSSSAFTIFTTIVSSPIRTTVWTEFMYTKTVSERQQFQQPLSTRKDFNEEDDDDEEEDDEPPEVGDVESFRVKNNKNPASSSPMISFGYNKGRSSPTVRKAIGKSSSSVATIYLCTHCGSEYVQWMGRCPTCKEWNTIQEHVVSRATTQSVSSSSSSLRPIFGGGSGKSSAFTSGERPVGSWLDDLPSHAGGNVNIGNVPIRITDLTTSPLSDSTATTNGDSGSSGNNHQRRIMIPDDDEFNTVLGGGIMKGSLILLGGDPGVGKSTLALQIAGTIAAQLSQPPIKIGMGKSNPSTTTSNGIVGPVWYVSGEENPEQIASRAIRLGIGTTTSAASRDAPPSELFLLRQTHVDTLCEQVVSHHMQPIQQSHRSYPSSTNDDDDDDDEASFSAQSQQSNLPISLLIIDSIQTMVCDAGGASHAGGITQVRECVAMFLRLAKSINVPILLIGHVTKSGEVAGPRTVEHMVDCVLYLDGMNDGSSGMTNLRMLRASKNRFGSSDEVGVYEMTRGRLLPVSDPSSLFLAHRNDQDDVEGCAIAIALEGMRAMTVEVQALVTMAAGEGNYGGRRTVNGISHSRLLLLLGVLQKRCHMFWSKQDVYINVVGRIRLDRGEGNAADLAIAVALASSRHSIPIRADTAFVGEIGLLGELRTVPAIEKRLQEARRMGFSRVITPHDYRSKGNRKKNKQQSTTVTHVNGIEWIQCTSLSDAINEGLVQPIPKRTSRRRPNASSKEIEKSTNEYMLEIFDDGDDEDDSFL